MRRLLCFALVLALALSLSSCTLYTESTLNDRYSQGIDVGFDIAPNPTQKRL
jgi:hypothetical protein